MPVVERFKQGFRSIKTCFGDRSERLQDSSQVDLGPDATRSVELVFSKSGKSSKQNDKIIASEQAQMSAHNDPTCLIARSSTEQLPLSNRVDFWLLASEKLRADDPALYEAYSHILQREGGKGVESGLGKTPKPLTNAATLIEVCQKSLQTMKSSNGRADKILGKTVEIVGLAKEFVGSAVSAVPPAAVAWAGVCLLLPLLVNPSQQDEACRKGLEDLPFLIQKYSLVESICAINSSNSTLVTASNMLSSEIIDLYTKILHFQAEVICQLSRSKTNAYFRKVFKADKWKEMHDEVWRIENQCWGMAQAIDRDRCSKLSNECKSKLAELYTVGSEFLEVSKQTYQAVVDLQHQSEQRETTKEEMECLQAFRSGNLYEEQKDRNPDRVKDTCKWLLGSQSFRDWRDRKGSGLLWISADPGCGKSVLSKAFVDEKLVATSSATVICYFFFKDISPEQRSVKKALGALIHQILSPNPQLWKHVMNSWKLNGKELCNLHDSMWNILEAIANDSAIGDIVCVIDALDECDSGHDLREHFIRRMHRLACRTQPCRMRFVVTSRPYAQMEEIFKGLKHDFPVIRIAGELESETISQEINLVITHNVAQLDMSETVKNRIINCLQAINHRTYLWLYLTMDAIRERISTSGDAERIEESLRTLPTTVEDAYEAILNKSPRRSETEKLLHIIVGAERPLNTEEINVGMNIAICYDGTQSFDDIHLENSEHYPTMLRNLCGLFIQIVDSKVYLIHQTAKEFLMETVMERKIPGTWKHCLEPQETQKILAQICISYLYLSNFNAWGNYDFRDPTNKPEMSRSFTLIEYSGKNWVAHYRRVPGICNLDKIVELCSSSMRRTIWLCAIEWMPLESYISTRSAIISQCYLRYQELQISKGGSTYFSELIGKLTTPLMIASSFKLYDVVKYITSKSDFHKQDLDVDHRRGSALSLAVENRSFEMVKLLVQKGADVNHSTDIIGSPLSMAARYDEFDIAEFLLDNGAQDCTPIDHISNDPFNEGPTKIGRYALQVAIMFKRHDITHLLLRRLCEPFPEHYLELAICSAVEYDDYPIEELLTRGVDLGCQVAYDSFGNFGNFKSPLGLALYYSLFRPWRSNLFESLWPRMGSLTVSVVSELLNLTSRASDKAEDAIDAVDTARRILDHSRNLGLILNKNESPIVVSALYGNMHILELLLKESQDIKDCRATVSWDRDDDYWRDLDWECEGKFGRDFRRNIVLPAPIYAGIMSSDERAIKFLIDYGVDINMSTELGTPLFYAAALPRISMVRILIEKGAQVMPYDSEGKEAHSPLVIAAARGHVNIVRQLLRAGAEVSWGTAVVVHPILAHKKGVEGKFYPSAIEAAEMEGHGEVVALLREHEAGSSIASVGNVGRRIIDAEKLRRWKMVV